MHVANKNCNIQLPSTSRTELASMYLCKSREITVVDLREALHVPSLEVKLGVVADNESASWLGGWKNRNPGCVVYVERM